MTLPAGPGEETEPREPEATSKHGPGAGERRVQAPPEPARRRGAAPQLVQDAGEHRDPPAPPARGGVREIAIRDTRRDEGPAAWIRSIGAQLERFRSEDRPFAVVLLSVTPAHAGGVRPQDSELEAALTAELRAAGGGSLTREREGRWWIVAARVDAIGAHDLALRLERTAAALAAGTNTPARISAGVALCPEDGTEASALAAHADVGLYASRRSREAL